MTQAEARTERAKGKGDARAAAGVPIRDGRQVRALKSPVRQDIVDALESAGGRSVAELGVLLGAAPDALYFHLRQLMKAGLVVECERRKTGRHVAVVYDVAARPVRLSYSPPVRPRDVTAVIASALRLAKRDFERAIVRQDIAVEGDGRELWGARSKGWVTQGQLERVNGLLQEISTIVRSGAPGPETRPVSVTFVLAPSPASARAEKLPKVSKKAGGGRSGKGGSR